MMARLPGVDAQALQESQWIGNDLMARTAKAVRERLADNRRTFARPRLPGDAADAQQPRRVAGRSSPRRSRLDDQARREQQRAFVRHDDRRHRDETRRAGANDTSPRCTNRSARRHQEAACPGIGGVRTLS